MDPLTGWLPNQLGHTGISSSPRRESNSSLLFTKQLHDRRATRAIWSRRRDSNPRLPRWQRSALPLSYACKEFPSRLSTARWMSCASHRSVGDRAITGRASRAPVHLVEARGFEPPIPCAQGRCDSTSLHLENSKSIVMRSMTVLAEKHTALDFFQNPIPLPSAHGSEIRILHHRIRMMNIK